MIYEKRELHLRHELKHRISLQDEQELSHRLSKLFSYDRNAGKNGLYRVNSLYFDTPYDKALRQKLDGVNEREKFRLRFYNQDKKLIRVEKKVKINGLCGKYSAQISEAQAERLLNGEPEILLQSNEPLLLELYSKIRGQQLQPSVIVSYDRRAFLYGPGNVRVTLDRNLKTGFGCRDFLNTEICLGDAGEGHTILEVKYDAFLPEIVRLAVQLPGRWTEPFSKYAVCRQLN